MDLVPVEILLIGGWIALTVLVWFTRYTHLGELQAADHLAQMRITLPLTHADERLLAMRQSAIALDRALSFWVSLTGLAIASFLFMIAIRRQAKGLSLLLPFVVLTIALAFSLFIEPEISRLVDSLTPTDAASDRDLSSRTSLFFRWAYVLELVKVAALFSMFGLLLKRFKVVNR